MVSLDVMLFNIMCLLLFLFKIYLFNFVHDLHIKNYTSLFIFLVIWLTKILRGTELACSLYARCLHILGSYSHMNMDSTTVDHLTFRLIVLRFGADGR